MRKLTFVAIFFIGLIALSGCSTVYHTVHGFGEGLAKDTKAAWKSVVKADEWVDEHAW
ncbi:MAG: hypothetical protein K9L86_06455 [Candidatus Omnitrophica bacterium]|nr:hypothetical protein [Candidatus Omnitrophota bacterium]